MASMLKLTVRSLTDCKEISIENDETILKVNISLFRVSRMMFGLGPRDILD